MTNEKIQLGVCSSVILLFFIYLRTNMYILDNCSSPTVEFEGNCTTYLILESYNINECHYYLKIDNRIQNNLFITHKIDGECPREGTTFTCQRHLSRFYTKEAFPKYPISPYCNTLHYIKWFQFGIIFSVLILNLKVSWKNPNYTQFSINLISLLSTYWIAIVLFIGIYSKVEQTCVGGMGLINRVELVNNKCVYYTTIDNKEVEIEVYDLAKNNQQFTIRKLLNLPITCKQPGYYPIEYYVIQNKPLKLRTGTPQACISDRNFDLYRIYSKFTFREFIMNMSLLIILLIIQIYIYDRQAEVTT
jgi:hypothetical protein